MDVPVAISGQEARFAKAWQVLRRAVDARAFPGASVAVTLGGESVALFATGRFTFEHDSPEATAETIYDVASLTKVLATTPMAMLLHERGQLDLDEPIARWFPEAGREEFRKITPRHLLAHSSGLPGYVRLFEQLPSPAEGHLGCAECRSAMLQAALAVPLEAEPGARAEYSDVGFILLGELLLRVQESGGTPSADALPAFCAREVFQPLGMEYAMFNPGAAWHGRIPPTEDDRAWRGRVIGGEVNDENAAALGGVAGHAGLFATALDVARFALCMLRGGAPILGRPTVELFARRVDQPAGSSRALGWDTPSAPSQAGDRMGPRTFGHLGFTGASLWIDPDRQLSITLLTNRTWPDRSIQAIREVRPAFHNAILEAL